MKANPLYELVGLYPRLKLILLQLLGFLTAEVGLVLKRNYSGAGLRNEPRVSARAERFAIETKIRFRNVGQNKWYEGKTENISGSGVLFRAKKLLALKTRIEMIFPLPIRGSEESGANVRCIGQTVRKASPVAPGGHFGLAATIEEYHLMHTEEASQA